MRTRNEYQATDRSVTPEAAPRFPNTWTNAVYVLLVGLILALSQAPLWLLIAAAAAAGLALWHVAAGSVQYRRFRELLPRYTKASGFVLLKSAVTFIEIAIVYLVTTSAGF